MFITEAKKFYIEKDSNAESESSNKKQHKPKNPTLNQFNNKLFCVVEKSNELEDEIARYLQQDIEPKETMIISYWHC